MIKHAPRLSRRAVFLNVVLAFVVSVAGTAYAATERAPSVVSDGSMTVAATPRASVSKQIELVSGSPTTTLFNVSGVARIEVTCTSGQSSTGAVSNGVNVAVRNTGRVDLPLVMSRASERPQFTRTSGSNVIPGGAQTELFSLDDGIDNAHRLRVDTVANRRMRLDLTAMTKHTPTGGCLVNATLTTS